MALNSKRLWNIIINQPLSASPTDVEILGLFKHVVKALGAQMAVPEAPKKRESAIEKARTAQESSLDRPVTIITTQGEGGKPVTHIV